MKTLFKINYIARLRRQILRGIFVGTKRGERSRWFGVKLTLAYVGIFIALEFFSVKITLSVAPLMLLTVFSTMVGGFRAGMMTAAICWVFIGHSFYQDGKFSLELAATLWRWLNWSIVLPAMVAMIDVLKRREQRKREYSEKRRRNAENERFTRLSEIINTQYEIAKVGPHFRELLQLIAEKTRDLTGASGSVVELVDGDVLVYSAATGKAAENIGFRIPAQGSFSGLCLQTRKELYCEDTAVDPRVNRAACEKMNIRSMIVVPLIHGDQINGVLKAYSQHAYNFSDTEINTLRLMAGLLAAAMSTATEFEKKQTAIASLQESEKNLIQAREAAEVAAEAKTNFLANMSHEIRTPINGVIGMTGLLLDTELSPAQRDYSETIRRSADTLLTLINDILDFSKIEAGKMLIESIEFNFGTIVDDLERTLAFAAQQKGLRLSHQLSDDLRHLRLLGDPSRINQVLTNLVSNAIKFTPSGSVEIRGRVIGRDETSLTARFEVIDTGVGISAEAKGRLFQAFVQADSSTSRKFGGTGLGLSICKRLVEFMNGSIGIEDAKPTGSVFWFTIPLKIGAKKRDDASKDTTHSLPDALKKFDRPVRILLAEDNPVNQKVVIHLLEKAGIRVDAVANGNEALDAIRLAPYDLILMDCQMPELDGYGASRLLRSSETLGARHIPIVALTANAMDGDRERCREAGMNDYLSKPFKPYELYRVIEKNLVSPHDPAKRAG